MMCSLKSYTSYPESRFFHVGTFILLHGDLSSLHVQFKRNPLTLNLFYTYSHSFLRACGVLCILWAWWAMMMSFCSTSPPRRRSMPWGLRDPEPWSDEPSSCPHGTSKLAARGGSPRHSGTAWGTCREQERAPCASPGRAVGLDRLQASGSGRDREDWTCVCPRRPPMVGELGVRERERDFSELVNISTEVGPWQFQHNAANGEKGERGRGWWVKNTAIIFHKRCSSTSSLSPSCLFFIMSIKQCDTEDDNVLCPGCHSDPNSTISPSIKGMKVQIVFMELSGWLKISLRLFNTTRKSDYYSKWTFLVTTQCFSFTVTTGPKILISSSFVCFYDQIHLQFPSAVQNASLYLSTASNCC